MPLRAAPILLLFAACLLPAQSEATAPVMHAETRVVQIDAVAVDSHGKPVPGLTKADFTVMDEGKPRAIDIFSASTGETEPAAVSVTRQTLPPHVFSNRNAGPPIVPGHSTVIVLDQVNAFFEDAGFGRQQVLDLMPKLKPDEQIALYVIARKRGLLLIQDYTTDRRLLLRSLSRYLPKGLAPRPGFPDPWPIGVQDRPASPQAPNDYNPNKQTLEEKEFVWKSNSEQARLSLQALAEHLALTPGRKSVYWVTQAFPARLLRGMGEPAWNKTFTALNEANVAVNTVDSRGLFVGSNPNGPTISAMQQIAETTGGKAYFGRNDMDAAMAGGIEAARIAYTLGFYLPDSERDNSFHALKVKVGRSGVQLFYRQGYYAGNTELPVPNKAADELEASLLNQVDSHGVGITARLEVSPKTVTIRLNLDPGTLSLNQKADGWSGRVDETFMELNESGNTLSRISDVKDFEITAAGRKLYEKDGVTWPFTLPLLPGAVKITIVVRDSKTGRTGSLTAPLQ